MTYALCNDGTRIYLEKAGDSYSAVCEAHGSVGVYMARSDADRGIYNHAVGGHQGMHSHACARS
jgi:hypothetical protein